MRIFAHVVGITFAMGVWAVVQIFAGKSDFLWELLVIFVLVGGMIDFLRHDLYLWWSNPQLWEILQRQHRWFRHR